MKEKEKPCFRCSGRKKVFKSGKGYSLVDMGGEKVDCPLCGGSGKIKVPVIKKKKKTTSIEGCDNDKKGNRVPKRVLREKEEIREQDKNGSSDDL